MYEDADAGERKYFECAAFRGHHSAFFINVSKSA